MFLYPIPREYVEAKLQKRAMENNNIYRRQGSEGNSPTAENGTHRSVENISHRSEMASYPRPNPMGASKPPCNGVCNMYCLCPYILFVFSWYLNFVKKSNQDVSLSINFFTLLG